MKGRWKYYGSDTCPACIKTKEIFKENKYDYIYEKIENIPDSNKKILEQYNYIYIPAIFDPKGRFFGGMTEMQKYTNRFKHIK